MLKHCFESYKSELGRNISRIYRLVDYKEQVLNKLSNTYREDNVKQTLIFQNTENKDWQKEIVINESAKLQSDFENRFNSSFK